MEEQSTLPPRHLHDSETDSQTSKQSYFAKLKKKFTAMRKKRELSFLRFWRSLTFPQRLYLTASLIWFVVVTFAEEGTSILLPVLMVMAGIVYEFWPKFTSFWHSLIGKAFTLFFYATLANFALAYASGLVNELTGISADALPYTHNLALILSVPSWFLFTTILVLTLLQLLTPLYLIILLILKPFGVHGLWHQPNYRFPFLTAFIRYVWMIAILYYVIVATASIGLFNKQTPFLGSLYSASVDVSEEYINDTAVSGKGISEPGGPSQLDSSELESSEITSMEEGESNLKEERPLSINVNQSAEEQKKYSERGEKFSLIIKQLLAVFVFEYEADGYSRCEFPAGSRVVEINDFEILVVTPNESSPVGYDYRVDACRSVGYLRTKTVN